MSYPFPFINKNLEVPKPKLYLCRPNKVVIDKIAHAYNITFNPLANKVYELSFKIPKNTMVQYQFKKYKLYNLIKPRYLIKAEFVWGTEFFTIDNPELNDGEQTWTIHGWLTPYLLSDKTFTDYVTVNDDGEESPVDIRQALSDALSKSYGWGIGHIDESLLNKYRSFQINGTALDFIYEIADKFDATIGWDTVNNQINMYDANLIGVNKGFHLSWKKYLKTFNKNINVNDMVTRLHCTGKDGLTFNSVSPIGQDYVEDYSYFLSPFERDDDGNIIKHSDYMSDELAGTLLDYQELIENNKDKFNNYLTELTDKQERQTELDTELFNLNTELSQVKDLIASFKNVGYYFNPNKVYSGSGWSYHVDLEDFLYYVVMGSCSGASSINCKINGSPATLHQDQWQVIKKINDSGHIDITVPSGQDSGDINFVICMVEQEEYESWSNEDIINKYNEYYKTHQVSLKQNEVTQVQTEINTIQNNINELRQLLDVNNNFTGTLLAEWDNFIKDGEFSDESYNDPKELMSAGGKELKKKQHPFSTFDIDIVNFFDLIDCQRDWNRLALNDIISADYDDGKKMRASIIGMDIDWDAGTIKLHVSDAKEIIDYERKFYNIFKQTRNNSALVNRKRRTWDSTINTRQALDDYINNSIYADKQPVIGGVNQTESFGQFGHLSKYDDQTFLTLYRGALIATSDGGQTWQVLASANGVDAQAIIGQLMLDQKTSIQSVDGSVQLKNDGGYFSHTGIAIQDGLPDEQINSELVYRSHRGAAAKTQVDNMAFGGVNLVARSVAFGETVESNDNVGRAAWSIQLRYNDINGFTIPIKFGGEYTLSFLAYANADEVKLNMSFNTKDSTDLTVDHEEVITTQPRLITWTVNYQDEDMFNKDNLLKFWMDKDWSYIDKIIVLTDIQLEYGNTVSYYRPHISEQ